MIQELTPNKSYRFYIKDWETPEGEVIKTAPEDRKFVKMVDRAPVGWPHSEMFYEVAMASGRTHLIHTESCERIEEI